MSGLWTPDGERPVPSAEPEAPGGAGGGQEELSAEDAALLRELAAAEEQLLSAPVEDIVANHCYGLFQLGALHLGQQPPHLAEARLAIDALAAIVDGLGDRLGDNAETMRDGLAQLRLAYVQIAAGHDNDNGAARNGA
jgi:hypothetical protein